ncbi:MAG: hypothetical protein P0Y59_03640 [Candidatus Sphingomonas phytovorans]|nr:hypothetical protein [Sphingomonas sp.]WEK00802.1 MAG: hypothetical protein P0Y59_03640 [Sphingomonas sp.]
MTGPLPDDPWSIGLYAGPDPLHLAAPRGRANPIMTREQVTDIPAAFVADPFLLRHKGEWHLFFEVLHHERRLGEIGWASSPDAVAWSYQGIVLREPFHLSYPGVFEHGGEVFMVPETLDAGAVRLYRADPFPIRWVPVADLLQGSLADPTPFRFEGRWWMFVCPAPSSHDALSLFFADTFAGPWQEHPASPLIVGDRSRARPGGRVVCRDGRLYRFSQDCGPRYGSGVRAFEIIRLTRDDYAERECAESPILGPSGTGWNGKGMHHVDAWQIAPDHWIAAVDGIRIK